MKQICHFERSVAMTANIALLMIGLSGCVTSRPEYKVTDSGIEKYSKSKSQITKDILSNGDTLVSTGTEIYILKRKER